MVLGIVATPNSFEEHYRPIIMTFPEILQRAASVQLVITDVDGVLTDGGVYYGDAGEVMKRFNIRDGMAVERLRAVNVETAIITGEHSESVYRRAEKLKIEHCYRGIKDKPSVVRELSDKLGIPLDAIAYIGDDVNDRDAMQLVGLTAAPADAFKEIVDLALYVCRHRGGNGAFREFAELIIEARQQQSANDASFGFR